jgi:SAM-dependent methyltransferase
MRVDTHDGEEVWAGALSCGPCGTQYPVVRGIPRFVGSGAYASSFGRQWNWFRAVQLDSANGRNESLRALEATTGWTDDDILGRLVLDVGVGAGRFAEIIADKGGEVVGVDLSRAIDAAYGNIGRRPNVHLVQADVFALPFRRSTFDLAYAIGVLHHTPDPAAAFARMAVTLKKGAPSPYLSTRYGWGHHGSDLIRLVRRACRTQVMLALAASAIPAYTSTGCGHREDAGAPVPDVGASGLALALFRHLRLVRRATSGSISTRRCSAGSGRTASETSRALRRADPHAGAPRRVAEHIAHPELGDAHVRSS